MLAGRIEGTAPYGWLGAGSTVEDHVTRTFQRLGAVGLPEPEKAALLSYVRAMAPPEPRAVPREPARQKLVDRGRELFESAATACSTCHDPARSFTDGLRHVVVREPRVMRKRPTTPDGFDTPSLRFVGGTAPYFHDGRFPTLEALLESPEHAMGYTLQLSRDERTALAAYLEVQ